MAEPEIIAAIRAVAWWTHANLSSPELYRARRESFTRLREALVSPPARVGRVSTEYGFLLRAARRLAACSDSNRWGEPYYERREAMAQLRGCLDVFDRAQGTEKPLPPSRVGEGPLRRVLRA